MIAALRKILLLSVMSSAAAAASLDEVIFMTEQYPPYNFEEDEKAQGIAVDTLLLMLQRAGSKQTREDIELLPWARGYKRAQLEPNTCLFSTARSEERENLFKWIGPISPHKVTLIAKKERNIRIGSAKDIQQYKIGTIRDDVVEQYLLRIGINLDDMERVSGTSQNIKKLNRDRIDLWAYGEDVAAWELKAHGFDPSDYESVYVLEQTDLYFSCHKDISDSVIRVLQSALDTLKADSEYKRVRDGYLR